eukprot:975285-Pyramimonas_sp.AAC.1
MAIAQHVKSCLGLALIRVQKGLAVKPHVAKGAIRGPTDISARRDELGSAGGQPTEPEAPPEVPAADRE